MIASRIVRAVVNREIAVDGDPDARVLPFGDNAMDIPEDWLVERKSLEEVQDDLSRETPSDLWVEMWWTLCDRMIPGDELWEFAAAECQQPADLTVDFHVGYAVVRGGRVVDAIEVPWMSGPGPV